MMMLPPIPEIRPARIEEDRELALRFQLDAYEISFGGTKRFFEKFGSEGAGYIRWLKDLQAIDARSVAHLWVDNKVVGQIELGIPSENASTGYVHFFYLIPTARGQGLGTLLDQYAAVFFQSHGLLKMSLKVTSRNQRAIDFYRRQGWTESGVDPESENILRMDKSIIQKSQPAPSWNSARRQKSSRICLLPVMAAIRDSCS